MTLNRLVVWIVVASEWLAAAGVLICVALNLAQVLFRYFLFAPLSWSEEVMRYTMISVAMFGATAALGRRELPTVDIALRSGGRIFRGATEFARAIAVSGFCLVVVVTGWATLRRAFNTVSPAAEIPLNYPYLAIFVGFALMGVLAIALLFVPGPRSGGADND